MPECPRFKLYPASSRDSLVYGTERPGYSPDNEKPGAVATELVDEWAAHMKEHGVKRILSLLGDDEVEWYAEPIETTLAKHGFDSTHYSRTSVFKPGAMDVMLAAFQAAEAANERIVVHCSGGTGRATLGLATWVATKYGLSAEEAVNEVVEFGNATGVPRKLSPVKLETLLKDKCLQGKH
ncbi:unnamed protein product [Vitrella brassicaformis CCMP3155]|uniref:Tyrosine specific protein phosphatases domain-containing protein n=1 Tax=Vitrella brassicaformis (strain CCMP3155) TaxID=1169540 RepID=A0A0G4FJU3_VITBC|nr:unnamed protein product [Vitrella brassicaformis CCMP3155]|mmetsp:Transcript_49608/g.124394  ORF Transcript_49608/g.124394 Transcript_49608/m.124394 type:complete len:181 (-) Transcript_49608:1135-1677(-)|eukprot:CEM14043.1 unnamed protein product [Vitrella brassicaformis CCMP3155]